MKNYEKDYHVKQIMNPYRSTEVFVDWIADEILCEGGGRILDMACGAGANTMYMANRFRESKFIGMDINRELIEFGNMQIKERCEFDNCQLFEGDWFHMEQKWIGEFDGVISFQTLLMFPDYREALKKLAELQPRWIAVSSLFYEGDIEYTIRFKDYYRPGDGKDYSVVYYNIHSMIRFKEYMKELGYSDFRAIPFDIDIDIPKTDNLDIGTYTVKTTTGKRLQMSAAMMMPWHFAIAQRK